MEKKKVHLRGPKYGGKTRRRRDPSQTKPGKGTEQKEEEIERRKEEKKKEKKGNKKKDKGPIQAFKKRLPKGAGVLLKTRGGGSSRDYEDIIKKYQEEISLNELGIPPIGIRKAR